MKTGMERIGKVTQKLARFRAGLLTVPTTDVWGQIILCWAGGGGVHPVHCRKVGSTPGFAC